MGSSHRHDAPRPLPRWMAALRERISRSFGHAAPGPRAGTAAPAGPAPRVASRPHVLVVDDDPSNLEDACVLLEHCGISPRSAVDGRQAVALAGANDFDLILMDLQMPVLDGLAATLEIREAERLQSRPRVPVVAYTSFALGDELLRDCGIDGVLAKPCSAHVMRECLRRWCKPEAAASGDACVAPSARSPR